MEREREAIARALQGRTHYSNITDYVAVIGMKGGVTATGTPEPTVGPDSADGRVMRDHREKGAD